MVVFPFVPVTPIHFIFFSGSPKYTEDISAIAFLTSIAGINTTPEYLFFCFSAVSREVTIADAPLRTASSIYFSPSSL